MLEAWSEAAGTNIAKPQGTWGYSLSPPWEVVLHPVIAQPQSKLSPAGP